jgi:hypothetical protein
MSKKTYRVRNWSEYNKSLRNRGSLTFWISEKIVNEWQSKGDRSGKRGRPLKYADALIESALTIRQLFNLPLRATEGFLGSVIELLALHCEIPDYTTLSKRSKQLSINLDYKQTKQARHILVDSTGVQVIGEGEWKVLNHGKTKHQLWRKLHIGIDAESQEILAVKMTDSVRLDGNYLPGLINKIPGPISQITGDGAYDKKNCYQTAYKRGAKPVFPPQHNAGIQRNKIKKDPALLARDETILFIGRGETQKEKRRQWKLNNNYYIRALIETTMSRLKHVFGDRMRSRNIQNQETDLMIRCKIINKMTQLGMPISEVIL